MWYFVRLKLPLILAGVASLLAGVVIAYVTSFVSPSFRFYWCEFIAEPWLQGKIFVEPFVGENVDVVVAVVFLCAPIILILLRCRWVSKNKPQ